MPQHETERDRLLETLRQFDRAVALEHPGRVSELVIVGGGALVLLGLISRPTEDIDAIRFPVELHPLMEEFGLNGRVLTWENHFPYNFDDRRVRLESPFKALRCYTASLEDLVVSKLYSNRDPDAADIREPAVLESLNWDLLAAAVKDSELSRLSGRRYQEMLHSYDEYRKECGPCES